MTHLEDSIVKAAQAVSLTPKEKASGRMALSIASDLLESDVEAFRLNDAEFDAGRAALQERIAEPAQVERPSFFGRLQLLTRLPAVAMGLILSTGLAVAANNALPGDSLYTIKINVIEPVISVLQPTPNSRAAWAVTILNHRLDEINELNAQPDLPNMTDRLKAAKDLLEEQTQKVVVETEVLSPEATAEIRQKAAQAIQEKADALRHSLEKNGSKTLQLDPILSTLDQTRQTLEDSSRSHDDQKDDAAKHLDNKVNNRAPNHSSRNEQKDDHKDVSPLPLTSSSSSQQSTSAASSIVSSISSAISSVLTSSASSQSSTSSSPLDPVQNIIPKG